MTVLDCMECRGVWLDRGELEEVVASLDADDRPRGSRLSRLMDFFS